MGSTGSGTCIKAACIRWGVGRRNEAHQSYGNMAQSYLCSYRDSFKKHHLLFNGKVERSEGGGLPVRLNPRKDKADLVAVPTLYDVAFENGLKTGEINWPATRAAGTLHDSFPDVPDNVGNMTPDLQWDLYEAGILDDMTNFALWQHSSPGRDRVWQQSASYLIENRMPNLLLVHLLNVDSTHHRYGVNTQPGQTALALADYHLNELLKSLETAGILDQTTLFIIADHGFVNTPKTLLPNVLLYEAGYLNLDEERRVTGGQAQVIATGGFRMIYFEEENPGYEKLIGDVKELFSKQEGIYKVVDAEDFHEYGLPHPDDTDQAGRLAIFTEPGYGLNSSTENVEVLLNSEKNNFSIAHHGFLNSFDQMNALFVAWGRGVKPGGEIGIIDSRSIAPAAARLLGLDFSINSNLIPDGLLKE